MSTRPRIRTVKPEMGQDEKFGQLSRDARLLFIGLISLADDEGRFRAIPSVIIGHWFPYDQDSPRKLSAWLGELVASAMVVLYEVEGVPYGLLPHFTDHQRVNRPTPSLLPEPSLNGHGAITEPSVSNHGDLTEASSPRVRAVSDRKGKEGIGRDLTTTTALPAADRSTTTPDGPSAGLFKSVVANLEQRAH